MKLRKTLRAFGTCLALLTVFALPSCNLFEGAGEDIESVGEDIDDAAEDAQDGR